MERGKATSSEWWVLKPSAMSNAVGVEFFCRPALPEWHGEGPHVLQRAVPPLLVRAELVFAGCVDGRGRENARHADMSPHWL